MTAGRPRNPEITAIAEAKGITRDYARKYLKLRETRQYDAAGNLKARSVVKAPLRLPHERMPNTVIARRSSLLDAENNIIQQWVIEKPEDAQKRLAWEEAARILAEPLPRVALIPPPVSAALNYDLLVVYPVGDHHLGMLSWKTETGADYDLDIASAC
jgi:hypothetical protein